MGIGVVTGEAAPFPEAIVDFDAKQKRLADLPLAGDYAHEGGEEWVVPVRWLKARSRDKAFWTAGLFANQNSAAKMRNSFTIDQVTGAFGLPSGVPPSRAVHADRG